MFGQDRSNNGYISRVDFLDVALAQFGDPFLLVYKKIPGDSGQEKVGIKKSRMETLREDTHIATKHATLQGCHFCRQKLFSKVEVCATSFLRFGLRFLHSVRES